MSKEFNRRDFLKWTGLGVGGFLLYRYGNQFLDNIQFENKVGEAMDPIWDEVKDIGEGYPVVGLLEIDPETGKNLQLSA